MNENNKKPKNTYVSAGVSIDKGEQLVDKIRTIAAGTHIKGVMNGLGGFGALFDLKQHEYRHPVLVSGTDGVGTKIKLAIQSGRHDRIGIDLVAMCVNDLLVQGAEPLFFLDYFACSRLDVEIATTVINGIAEGCKQAGCALIGGETAEMPGMYADGDYDLAGFCVGVVEKENIIDGSMVKAGDILIGLGSSGPHSNGYSLIRKIFTDENISYDQMLDDRKFIDVLIEPTSIYVKPVMQLLKSVRVNAMAHITGGGLYENIPRVMPKDVQVVIDTESWQWPEIFSWLQESGNIDTEEMYRTFNCGVGMVICVNEKDKNTAIKKLDENGVTAFEMGKVTAHAGDPVIVIK